MGTSFQVGLEFSAKTQQLDQVVSKIQKFERDIAKLKGADPFQGVENSAKGAGTAVDGLSRKSRAAQGAMSGLAAVAGRVTAAFGVATVAQKAFNAGVNRIESERRLTALADAYGEVGAAQAAAARAAQKFGLSQTEANQSFAQIYARLRPIGTSLKEIETAYNGFNTAAKLSGASVSEASSAWLQLSQALGSGVLRGEELNSVFEQTPGVVQAIAKEMGAPIGQIRQLAQDGKITSDIVIRALKRIETEGSDKLAAALGGPQQKIKNLENAFENLGVAITRHIVPAITKSLQGLAFVINGLSNALDTMAGKSLGADLMKRVSKGNFAGMVGARSEQLDQYERVLGLLNSPQKNRGGLVAQLQTARELSGRLRGIKATGNPEADARIQALQGKAMGLIQTFEGLIQGIDKAAKNAAGTSTTTKQQTKLDDTKKTEEAVRRGVIGGMTGGGQSDASRGRSTGPHLHAQLVRGTNLEALVDKALDFGGGRTASSFGLGRGAASHGYPGRDYYTPQGTPFTLKPGWSASDMGIQGALGRGMRVSGPGGAFELGHLQGVKTGDLNGKGAAGDLLGAQQEALNNAIEFQAKLEEQLATSKELAAAAQLALQIAKTRDPLQRAELEGLKAQQEIKQKFAELQGEALSAEELLNLQLAEKAELEIAARDAMSEYVKQLYEALGVAGLLSSEIEKLWKKSGNGGGAGNFRTDIDLNPNQSKTADYMNKLKAELMDTEGMIISLAGTIESEIGSAMSSAVTGLIEGTTTAQEAFSQMFKNIGKAFIEMATQMIAKAIVMKILGIAFGGGGGGGAVGSKGSSVGAALFGGGAGGFNPVAFEGAGFTPFADGGFVTGPTNALIGEGGSNEYVIPENKMGSAMAKWNAGARGDAVVDGADPTGASGGRAGAPEQPAQINITGGVYQFGGSDYIRKDQLPGIISQAGKQGESRALRRLQMSAATRRKVGI